MSQKKMAVKHVAWERFLKVEADAKRANERLDRLIDHVNRELGVSQDVPVHGRIATIETRLMK